MAIWRDPVLPKIKIPENLQTQTFQIGSAKYKLLPAQYEFLSAKEEDVSYIGGVGCGKTRIGSIKATLLSMFPQNRGIVGRMASTDLLDTTQRDLLDFLREAQLLKKEPDARKRTAEVFCVDPQTGKNLGFTSEISFQHLDDPDHLMGRHLGWFWIDEGTEVHKKAWTNLISRRRWPAFRGRYQSFITGNPQGHDWVYDYWFNKERLETMICGSPKCTLSQEDCNRRLRRSRRGIHTTTFENYFLPPDYIDGMLASYTPEERERYLGGSFDAFEGGVFKEFSRDTHVLHL